MDWMLGAQNGGGSVHVLDVRAILLIGCFRPVGDFENL